MGTVELAKEETEGITAECVDDIGEQELAAEAEHLPGRTEVDAQ